MLPMGACHTDLRVAERRLLASAEDLEVTIHLYFLAFETVVRMTAKSIVPIDLEEG